jgi:hypothetical protein
VASAAEEIDHFLQRRIAERSPAGSQHALDVSEEPPGGAKDFQGQVLRAN